MGKIRVPNPGYHQLASGNGLYYPWVEGLSSTGRWFAGDSESARGRLVVWSVASGKPVVRLTPRGSNIQPFPFGWSSDGNILTYVRSTTKHDGSFILQRSWCWAYDARTGKQWLILKYAFKIRFVTEEGPSIGSLAWSPHDRWLLFGFDAKHLWLQRYGGGRICALMALIPHASQDGPLNASWSPQGDLLGYSGGPWTLPRHNVWVAKVKY